VGSKIKIVAELLSANRVDKPLDFDRLDWSSLTAHLRAAYYFLLTAHCQLHTA
jgi:hypothetical protein